MNVSDDAVLFFGADVLKDPNEAVQLVWGVLGSPWELASQAGGEARNQINKDAKRTLALGVGGVAIGNFLGAAANSLSRIGDMWSLDPTFVSDVPALSTALTIGALGCGAAAAWSAKSAKDLWSAHRRLQANQAALAAEGWRPRQQAISGVVLSLATNHVIHKIVSDFGAISGLRPLRAADEEETNLGGLMVSKEAIRAAGLRAAARGLCTYDLTNPEGLQAAKNHALQVWDSIPKPR